MGTEQFPVPIQLLSNPGLGTGIRLFQLSIHWHPHSPKILCFLGSKYPKKFPGALRAPDGLIPQCFCAFGLQIPQNLPGALRAPDRLIPLCFLCFWAPNTPKFPRRASRAGWLESLWFLCFWAPNTPKFSRRASRAGSLDPLMFCALGLQIPHNFPGALRAPDCFISLYPFL